MLGPSDWSVGMMADRSAAWYFDRDLGSRSAKPRWP